MKSASTNLFFANEFGFEKIFIFFNCGKIISNNSIEDSSLESFVKTFDLINFLNSSNNLSLDKIEIPPKFFFIALRVSGLCLCFE